MTYKRSTIDSTPATWWAVVYTGAGPYPMPPRGPWASRKAAGEALDRWRTRVGADAGTIVAAHSVRLYGYTTRAAARDADISDEPGRRGCVQIGGAA